MDKFNKLRQQYPIFIYESYTIEETCDSFKVVFHFDVPGLTKFNPTWSFPKPQEKITKDKMDIFERTIFNLGMVEVLSYLKSTCSPTLIVKAGSLNEEQIAWYKKLYVNGLGEFFYKNDIVEAMNIETFVDIKCEYKEEEKLKINNELYGNLVPVGGGKDSALTLEILKDMDNLCYIVNPRGASLGTALTAGYNDRIYTPKRTLDKKLLELNGKGFLNGHTPFSAILAFSSYAAAILLERKYIVLSNEASANEGNVKGTKINHQYSKGIEFENDFRNYVSKYICENGPEYFSLLRPISEWQIVRGFVKNPKYFEVFKSCNAGSKQDIWCENCSKCLYVYIMLNAFLSDEEMKKIFKQDLLDRQDLRDIFNGLVYPDYDKPFECVGTKEEVNLSIEMIKEKYLKEGKDLPCLLKDFKSSFYDLNIEINRFKEYWNNDNNLKPEFVKALKSYIK